MTYTLFFVSNAQPQCCLTFSWIELQMLLWCCLMCDYHYIETNFTFSIFVCMFSPRSVYVVFMWSIFLFQPHLELENFLLFLDDNVDEEKFSNSKSSTSKYCLAFAWLFANFSLPLLIKLLLMKKACIIFIISLALK